MIIYNNHNKFSFQKHLWNINLEKKVNKHIEKKFC